MTRRPSGIWKMVTTRTLRVSVHHPVLKVSLYEDRARLGDQREDHPRMYDATTTDLRNEKSLWG